MNKMSLLLASLSTVVGLSAYANTNHYPDVKSSSANTNSATSNRLQDPTNPSGAYDTDKSGYANRWNAEDRITAQPMDETHWRAGGATVSNPAVTHTTSSSTISTTRSSANMNAVDVDHNDSLVDHSMDSRNDRDLNQRSYTTSTSDRPRTYTESDRSTINTSMSGATTSANNTAHDAANTTANTANRTANSMDNAADRTANSMNNAADRTANSMNNAADQASDTAYRADNTGINKRDRNAAANTADHQAGKGMKSDVELTRKIRRELTKDESLSTYGKNVKIITKNGEATLRGPVQNDEEKTKIEDAAERIVGTNKVRNELEIKH